MGVDGFDAAAKIIAGWLGDGNIEFGNPLQCFRAWKRSAFLCVLLLIIC